MGRNLVFPSSMPYDEINIIDNSVYEDNLPTTIPGVPTGPIAYIPFISPRGYGEDNKLVYMTADRLTKYGIPNITKYGLSLYLANRFAQGGGTVLGMRVVPEYVAADTQTGTAAHGKSYANACVYAVVDTTSHTIEYGVYKVTGPNVKTLFTEADATAITGGPLAEGKTLYKLFAIRAKAAGDFANSFYFQLANDSTMNTYAEESGIAAHFYRFVDSDGGETLDGNLVFSFVEGFLYEGESMDPVDVFEAYSENVVYEKIDGSSGFDAFMTAIGADGSEDIFFPAPDATDNKLYFTNADATKYEITNTAINATIHLSNAVPLWTTAHTWEVDPFAESLAMAYGNKGDTPTTPNDIYTDLIYDQNRYPFQYIFAPSYDPDLVESIHELVLDRDMTHAFYVVPYRASYPSQITAWNAEAAYKACTDFREHIYPEWCFVRDPYSAKRVQMPSVYMNAYAFPKHWLEKKGRPYAGIANFVWTDFITGTVSPATSSEAQYIANHNARFNTMIEDGYGNCVPYEQITCQTKMSALSECNNSFVLTDMIRIGLALANSSRWSDLTDDAIALYRDKVFNSITAELGSCYDYIDVLSARESVNGAGRNRIRCSITVKFKDILKGVSYTFYISAT